ncbi:hypothetical protein [Leptolyngbya sp. 7M]|uniref:hypothetical protein n=1 Tax=Leptolyngbya sp. 7M TaxID=2812896 RepID=UPI001B8AF442|nr:hypothetical protein [Leptolyngbya sp. 7M]QYO64107.1 hypothetical protein JVX88_30810 [Leptolyngbya sp. 7M]
MVEQRWWGVGTTVVIGMAAISLDPQQSLATSAPPQVLLITPSPNSAPVAVPLPEQDIAQQVNPSVPTVPLPEIDLPANQPTRITPPLPTLPLPEQPLPQLPAPEDLLPTPAPVQPEDLPGDVPATVFVERFNVVGSTVFTEEEIEEAMNELQKIDEIT